jgi:hypothetical protein
MKATKKHRLPGAGEEIIMAHSQSTLNFVVLGQGFSIAEIDL